MTSRLACILSPGRGRVWGTEYAVCPAAGQDHLTKGTFWDPVRHLRGAGPNLPGLDKGPQAPIDSAFSEARLSSPWTVAVPEVRISQGLSFWSPERPFPGAALGPALCAQELHGESEVAPFYRRGTGLREEEWVDQERTAGRGQSWALTPRTVRQKSRALSALCHKHAHPRVHSTVISACVGGIISTVHWRKLAQKEKVMFQGYTQVKGNKVKASVCELPCSAWVPPEGLMTSLFSPKQTSFLPLWGPPTPNIREPASGGCINIWGSNQVFLLLTAWVQRSHIPARPACPEGSSHPSFQQRQLGRQFLGFSQAGLQAWPEHPEPRGQQGLWVWKLCPVLNQGALATQHHEAGQEGALGSARAGFSYRRLYFPGGFRVSEAGLGPVDAAGNKTGPPSWG